MLVITDDFTRARSIACMICFGAMMASDLLRLRELSLALLESGDVAVVWRGLSELLSRVAADHAIGDAYTDTKLATGFALSPAGAAACIEDPLRTALFVRGEIGRASCRER